MPLGKLSFKDRVGGSTSCLIMGVNNGGALVSLADSLKGFSNAEIVEAAIRENEILDPGGSYPLTDPPFDSISVRVKLVYRITDPLFPDDEPDLLTFSLYCPMSSLLEISGGVYVLPTDAGVAIGEAITNAIGWTISFQYSEVFGVQV